MSGDEIPQPLQNIGPQVYVVICKGCMYYFKDEYSKSALGKFSLYGYNSVTRSIKITPKQGPWAFMITHTHPEDFRLYYFAASSEREMKEWMKHVKCTLVEANGKQASDHYYTYKKAADNKSAEDDEASVTYHEIEMKIYEDSTTFQISKDYKKKFQIKGKDEASDEDDDPPPVPKTKIPQRDPASRPARPLPAEDTTVAPAVPPRRSSEPTNKPKTDSSPKPNDRRRGSDETHTRKRNGEKPHHRELPAIPKDVTDSPRSSRKQKEATPQQETVPEEEEGDDEDGGYWNAIYYHGNNSEKATELIRSLGGEGTFLVRNGTNGKVLVVNVANNSKKYEIKTENGRFFLKKVGPYADTLEELLYEYHSLNLPTCNVKLTVPFRFHPKFKQSML